MTHPCLHNHLIKAEAQRLGFSACGVSPAEPVGTADAERLHAWLTAGHQAGMSYMSAHETLRLDPRKLVEGVRTIVSVALNYFPARQVAGISLYAQGRDYHDVMRQRLQQLLQAIGATGRCFVDTAPVLERYWAWRGGLGWIGRNRQLIVPGRGSAFFLGELFLMEEVDHHDQPLEGNCGGCERCVVACPTGALTANGLDARRCLSYLTIEHRGELPPETRLTHTFYGCDCCQLACPHMRHAQATAEACFQPSQALLRMTPADWRTLRVEQYQEIFQGSAVKRAKYEGLTRNIAAWH